MIKNVTTERGGSKIVVAIQTLMPGDDLLMSFFVRLC